MSNRNTAAAWAELNTRIGGDMEEKQAFYLK